MGTKTIDVRPRATEVFLERYAMMWVAGKVHWCSKRTKTALCDKDFKGVAPAEKGEVVMCSSCRLRAALKVREYGKQEAKKLQGSLFEG